MLAAVLRRSVPSSVLEVEELPVPVVKGPGWVRIAVKAAGMNRSDLHLRKGLSDMRVFPIIPGIEAVGTVDDELETGLRPGQQVAAMLGGMGRLFDGGHAEFTVVPASTVVPFRSDLPWATIGQVPETLQTAYGSVVRTLAIEAGQRILVRGGTSALGFAATAIAKERGAIVLSTTRSADRLDTLAQWGADVPILDTGNIAAQIHEMAPGGVDAALELVGAPTLRDTLLSTRPGGTVCFTGMLSNSWIIEQFYPIDFIPRGVRLTSYSGNAADLPPSLLQRYLDRIERGEFCLGPRTDYHLRDMQQALQDIDSNTVVGKVVIVTGN
ncbi:zinc-binding dehydrogenase [Mycobacterium sp. CBMA271]|uniref:zinc-binding dehydrogenase n=1 Tax=unclassified Mycobacteroides TaxID=2618759 RepID=UPI0012DF3F4A|nr:MULTISPECIES: zinc-binding dehydrogenase [unclassified Mycobacteroides]MUM18877.1 NADPH:quinone reductase [Mycobacteroides sp. CBMA 326]MUM23183.1 zinc-binding dehydrogenase [Mycobacteroides sp. CBMA 271]